MATHRLTGSLPFYRGAQGMTGAVLGGWQLNGILSLQSGFPFTVVTSEDYNRDGVMTDRPNAVTAIGKVVADGPAQFLNGSFGGPENWSSLFRPAPAGTTPMLGRNTFRGPGYGVIDASLFKEFGVRKVGDSSLRVQFRAEAFNLTNRVNLRGVTNSLGTFSAITQRWSNVNFGRSVAAFEGRQIQFALKLLS